MKRDLSLALSLLLLFNAAAPAAAAAPLQTTPPQQQPARPQPTPTPAPAPSPAPAESDEDDDVVRITANLVQFDAVVTDGEGRIVTDLRPEDFEVQVEGKPQEITNFSFVSVAAPPAPAAEMRPDRGAPAPPPTPLRSAQVRRTIALVVDDLGTSFEDMHFVRQGLRKFVDEQMQPGDLVAIIQTGKGLGALQQFTTDRQLLHRAIERVRWNPIGRAGVSTFAPAEADPREQAGGARGGPGARDDAGDQERDAGAALEDFRKGVFTVGTLGALDFIVRGMDQLPGRKSVVLFSGGFQLFRNLRNPNESRDTERVLESVRRLTDQANRASVTIYSVDARGLATTGLTAADDVRTPQQAIALQSSRNDELFLNREGLAYLADQTGGIFIRNTNDFAGGVRQALQDQSGYYLIGFRPPAEAFQPERGRARFNKFKVRVRRSGLRVRTRAGFYGVAEAATRPAPRTRAEQMVAALSSPIASGGVGLRLTSLFNSPADGSTVVDSLIHIDVSQFRLADEADGWKRAVFDIVALTFGENGQIVDTVNRTETVRARAEALDAVRANGLVYLVKVPVAKPGAYQLRVAVRDAASERVGSASQFIEVPDLRKGRLALSGIFMTGAGEVPKAGGEAAAQSSAAPLRDATLRRFRQGALVDFSYHVYNAKADRATGQPRLLMQTRLFRDGRAVYESPAQPYDAGALPAGATRVEAGRRLQLGAQLPPGDYVLQVVVTDELAKGSRRTATQWIDFEIVK
ncbi:MAG TPA: VWA domain-containing protein [Pyrinomonadaceae bacterium]|jgi:VWFA-related protein